MKGSGTRLRSSIANGGKGRRTRKEAPDETIWFDETKKITDTTENTPPVMNLSGHRLLSAESLQQFIESNSSCSKCSEKLRLQAYNIAYKQGMADLQMYLIQKCQGKRSIEDKYNEFIESHDSFIDSTESSESPSQITRLIVADNVSPFLGIASQITCAQCDERKYIEPVICKNKEGNYEKGNQSEHFAINNMFVLGCHEAGMSPVDVDIICSSLSLPLQIGYWSRKGRFKNLEQRVGDAEVVATEKSMREAMNEEVRLTLDVHERHVWTNIGKDYS